MHDVRHSIIKTEVLAMQSIVAEYFAVIFLIYIDWYANS